MRWIHVLGPGPQMNEEAPARVKHQDVDAPVRQPPFAHFLSRHHRDHVADFVGHINQFGRGIDHAIHLKLNDNTSHSRSDIAVRNDCETSWVVFCSLTLPSIIIIVCLLPILMAENRKIITSFRMWQLRQGMNSLKLVKVGYSRTWGEVVKTAKAVTE